MKPGEWCTAAGASILNSHREEILAAVRRRESLPTIAKAHGSSHTNLLRWLRTTGIYDETVKCLLVECEVTFPFKPGKLCCCRKHVKRLNGRGNNPAAFVECALPECRELVLNTKKRFCGAPHATTHYKREETGFYARLQVHTPACEVCGEWRVLDEHHVEFTPKGSNKRSKTVWLCPTHHLAMHRRLAVYDEGGFRWVDSTILVGLAVKHPELLTKG
jgi:hypothetical protein